MSSYEGIMMVTEGEAVEETGRVRSKDRPVEEGTEHSRNKEK